MNRVAQTGQLSRTCRGITKKVRFCKRKVPGAWRFCDKHRWQPITLFFGLILTVLAFAADLMTVRTSLFPGPSVTVAPSHVRLSRGLAGLFTVTNQSSEVVYAIQIETQLNSSTVRMDDIRVEPTFPARLPLTMKGISVDGGALSIQMKAKDGQEFLYWQIYSLAPAESVSFKFQAASSIYPAPTDRLVFRVVDFQRTPMSVFKQ